MQHVWSGFYKGKRAVMKNLMRAGSPSWTLCQDALLCFQRRLYDVSHGLWFQVNKTVVCEEITQWCRVVNRRLTIVLPELQTDYSVICTDVTFNKNVLIHAPV